MSDSEVEEYDDGEKDEKEQHYDEDFDQELWNIKK
jgi:hypothetical protein